MFYTMGIAYEFIAVQIGLYHNKKPFGTVWLEILNMLNGLSLFPLARLLGDCKDVECIVSAYLEWLFGMFQTFFVKLFYGAKMYLKTTYLLVLML